MAHAEKIEKNEKQRTMGITAFLRARRSAVEPAAAGLPATLNRRRVPGLRREEVAQLAGISVDYYTRIEQGRARGVSEAVLDGLGRALGLTPDERVYLGRMAAPRFGDGRGGTPVVSAATRRLLDTVGHDVPAFVLGPGLDYLAWNRLGARLVFDLDALEAGERNAALLSFLHPGTRALHPDWEEVASDVAAALRADAGRYPCHPRVREVVTRLLRESEEFRHLWEEQVVDGRHSGRKRLRHPWAGELRVTFETFRSSAEPEQVLCVYTAEPGSASARALRELASSASSASSASP